VEQLMVFTLIVTVASIGVVIEPSHGRLAIEPI
jgi:hypothetical protein